MQQGRHCRAAIESEADERLIKRLPEEEEEEKKKEITRS